MGEGKREEKRTGGEQRNIFSSIKTIKEWKNKIIYVHWLSCIKNNK